MRISHSLEILTCLALATTLAACEPVGIGGGELGGDPAVNDNSAPGASLSPFITDGQPDPGHPSVGKLSSSGAACTATLVGKRTVLTAGHCVKSGTTTFTVNNQKYYANQIIRHPSYGGGNSNDVALVILQQEPQGVARSPIATQVPTDGQVITLVGFGKTSENASDYGTKRYTTNTISRVYSSIFSIKGSKNICNGDSGGPTFAQYGGQEVVIGVHSTKSGWCGNGGNDMRVDRYVSWIKQSAGGDVIIQGQGGGGGNPGGGAPTPSPGQPPPPGGAPPPPGANPNLAYEGMSCQSKTCASGLKCVQVWQGQNVSGKYCMERCAKLGADPNCDGAETCTQSNKQGKVCFAGSKPQGGYTDNSPGSSQYKPMPANPGGGGTPGGNGGGSGCGSVEEDAVFKLLNQVRAQNGAGAVKCDPAAAKVARAHSQDMCNKGYFSHTSPGGKQPWDRLKAGGVSFSSAGENIAKGYQTPQAVHSGWMNSSGHRKNMLSPSWTRVGIGMIKCNGGTPYWTEVFMR